MNRREFLTNSSLATAALASGVIEGCSFGSVMSSLGKYLPIALQALAGVATLLGPEYGVAISALVGLVNRAFGALQGAVNSYNSAPAVDKQNVLGEVLTAIDAVQTSLANVTQSLGVANSTVVKAAIAALLLISTTLGSIEATLAPKSAPAVSSFHVSHAKTASVSSVNVSTGITVTGKPSDFKKTYNTIMQQAGRADLKL